MVPFRRGDQDGPVEPLKVTKQTLKDSKKCKKPSKMGIFKSIF